MTFFMSIFVALFFTRLTVRKTPDADVLDIVAEEIDPGHGKDLQEVDSAYQELELVEIRRKMQEPISCPANAQGSVDSCVCDNYYHPSGPQGFFDNGGLKEDYWEILPAEFQAGENWTCVPVACPANSHHDFDTGGRGQAVCVCDQGYLPWDLFIPYKEVEDGATCEPPKCIPNSHFVGFGGCACDVDFWPTYEGDFEDENYGVEDLDEEYTCVSEAWPDGAILDYWGEMYCSIGFKAYNNDGTERRSSFIPGEAICKPECPANSSRHPGTSRCFCDNGLWPNDTDGPRAENDFGLYREDVKCEVEVNCPAHASFNGSGCICDNGFMQSGPAGFACDSYSSFEGNWTCELVNLSCPSNASLHECDLCRCDDGFWPSTSDGGKTDNNVTFKHNESYICESIAVCPANSYPKSNSKGSTCRCEDGFWPSNQGVKSRNVEEFSAGDEEWTCEITCPANSSWRAADRYPDYRSYSADVEAPEGAEPIIWIGCLCDDGFWPSGSGGPGQRSTELMEYIKFDFWTMTCKPITCPANSYNSHFDVCTCNDGFLSSSPRSQFSVTSFPYWAAEWTCEAVSTTEAAVEAEGTDAATESASTEESTTTESTGTKAVSTTEAAVEAEGTDAATESASTEESTTENSTGNNTEADDAILNVKSRGKQQQLLHPMHLSLSLLIVIVGSLLE